MRPEDEADLRELQAELAGMESTREEPACIARAFSTEAGRAPFVFRMQTWIDLAAAQSPLLDGKFPDVAILPALADALAAFGQTTARVDDIEPEDVITIWSDLLKAVDAGFATVLPMEPDGPSRTRPPGGFGDWLPLYGFLVGQLYISPAEARQMPVAEAWALLAVHRWNQGWNPKGTPYLYREEEETHG